MPQTPISIRLGILVHRFSQSQQMSSTEIPKEIAKHDSARTDGRFDCRGDEITLAD
jgi:hypothetical protein